MAWLGFPTWAKVVIDAVARFFGRRKKQEDPELGLHTFYTTTTDTIGQCRSEPGSIEQIEIIQGWVNGTPSSTSLHGASHPAQEPASAASFEGEDVLMRSVSLRSSKCSQRAAEDAPDEAPKDAPAPMQPSTSG
ncbi:hypothetical protein ACHAPT_006214 [Fusarium lateritium]